MESKKLPPYTAEEGVEALPASSTKQDDNYDIYQRYRGSEFTPEEEARVLRKIDIRLIPLLFGIYLIQYLDKNSLNFASVYGLKTGTKLEGQDYSWLGAYSSCPHSLIIACSCLSHKGSIFYIGYLVGQYPSGLALQKLPIGKFLSITTLSMTVPALTITETPLLLTSIVWGGLLMTTPACHNFPGIAANRLVLGIVESTVNPGFVLMMGIWYTTKEQPLRLEAYYCTNGIATMFGG